MPQVMSSRRYWFLKQKNLNDFSATMKNKELQVHKDRKMQQ
jgi:hypothetical protein